MLKEIPIELKNQLTLPPEVFLFVNPLTGKHAKTKVDSKLAVFRNEKAARKWEKTSKILKEMVGYHCPWEEMLGVAIKETQGQYEYFMDTN
jgi:hypothetical protein